MHDSQLRVLSNNELKTSLQNVPVIIVESDSIPMQCKIANNSDAGFPPLCVSYPNV